MNELFIVKIIVLISCAACKLIGDLCWHNAQRYIMPVIIMIGIDLILHSWWLGALSLPLIGALVMGYKDYGPSDGFDRAVWLMLIVLAEGLGLAIAHHLSWFLYVPWVILAAVWGGVTRAWWNVIIAPISGLIIGVIVFLIH